MTSTFIAVVLTSCGYKEDRSEELEHNGAKLLFKHFSKTTIETTLRRYEISYKPAGSGEEKIVIGVDRESLEIFPTNKDILKGTDYVVIDTTSRSREDDPTHAPHTLYLDPAVFSREDYEAIVALVKDLYSRPVSENKLVQWMDSDVIGLEQGDTYFTIYAIVHEKLSTFEPKFESSNGKDWLKIRVNNEIYFHDIEKSGLQSEGYWDYTLIKDTLYYPDYVNRSRVDSLLQYKQKDGSLFGSRVRTVISREVN